MVRSDDALPELAVMRRNNQGKQPWRGNLHPLPPPQPPTPFQQPPTLDQFPSWPGGPTAPTQNRPVLNFRALFDDNPKPKPKPIPEPEPEQEPKPKEDEREGGEENPVLRDIQKRPSQLPQPFREDMRVSQHADRGRDDEPCYPPYLHFPIHPWPPSPNQGHYIPMPVARPLVSVLSSPSPVLPTVPSSFWPPPMSGTWAPPCFCADCSSSRTAPSSSSFM